MSPGALPDPLPAWPERASERLPEILETKVTLAGVRKAFRCRVLARGPGEVVVLFVSDRPYQVADLPLPAGTVTFGYFWSSRPYNVYHWMTPAGVTLAHYCNLSDRTVISIDALEWRDLAVDVLIRADGRVEVLDEHELPEDLDAPTRDAVGRAQAELVATAPQVAREIGGRSRALWSRLAGAEAP
jgi:hypothetical protein